LAVDITPPNIVSQSNTFYLDSLGQLSINVGDITASVSDSCGMDTVTLSQYNFSCSDTGTSMINIIAKDVNNNISNALTQITILDTTAPVFNILAQHTIYLNNFGLASFTFADVSTGTAFDACGISDTIISQSIFTCSNTGPQIINVELKDANGNTNSKNFLLSVLDTIHPDLTIHGGVFFIDTLTGIASIKTIMLSVSLFP